jgi:ribonuclease HI
VLGVFRTAPSTPASAEASLLSPAVRLNATLRKYAARAAQLAKTHPIARAIARLQATDPQQTKKLKQLRQLLQITSSIPSTHNREIEKIVPYRFRPWDSLNYKVTVSRKTKEEEAIAHTAYIQSKIGDNFIAIYSDASKIEEGKGIGVGVIAYNSAQEELYAEKSNIGDLQLVYNGELEGIAKAFEYAARNARRDQEIHVYADNQAAIYRLSSLADSPGQQWLLRCLKAAKTIQSKKAGIHLQWAPGHVSVQGNERADALAKEAAKEEPYSTATSLAFLGTEIRSLQLRDQSQEWQSYREKAIQANKHTYSAKFPLTFSKTIQIPRGTPRKISSAFFSLKLGHGYFNAYLERAKKRDSNLCSCGRAQTPEHLLLYCWHYNTERQELKAALHQSRLTIQLLLHTTKGREATLAFITRTRVGTRGWHLGQEPED